MDPQEQTSGSVADARSRRRRDRLVGALAGAVVTLVVLVAAAVVTLAVVSEPAGAPPGGSAAQQGADPVPAVPTAAPDDLGDDETWLGRFSLDAASVVLPGSVLDDVRATGQGLRSGPQEARAAVVDVTATVPFDVVAAEIGPDASVRPAAEGASGDAAVSLPVELLGRQWQVRATGTVDVVDGRLVLAPTDVEVEGLGGVLNRGVAAVARAAVQVETGVEGLPEGLVLQEVAVVDDGFRAELSGEDVVLVPGAEAPS